MGGNNKVLKGNALPIVLSLNMEFLFEVWYKLILCYVYTALWVHGVLSQLKGGVVIN